MRVTAPAADGCPGHSPLINLRVDIYICTHILKHAVCIQYIRYYHYVHTYVHLRSYCCVHIVGMDCVCFMYIHKVWKEEKREVERRERERERERKRE